MTIRKHTVAIAHNGSTLTLRGEDVNTCSGMGFVRHSATEAVKAFLGFDGPVSMSMVRPGETTSPADLVFERAHVLTVAPMVKRGGVWHTDDTRAVRADVTVTSDYRA